MSIWIVGTGTMAAAYLSVLRELGVEPLVVGRTAATCHRFAIEHGVQVFDRGVVRARAEYPLPSAAIVATSLESLATVATELLKTGTKRLLVEKPAALTANEVLELSRLADERSASVFVGYNRRFYASVAKAREVIAADGGVLSCHFDFTEMVSRVLDQGLSDEVVKNWFVANSTHVVDLAFHLAGEPLSMTAHAARPLPWHPNAAFVGHGVTANKALFSYHSDWESGGRWGLEICTPARRLIFRPIEKLHQMAKGGFAVEELAISDTDDLRFKPGLLRQCEAFLFGTGADHLMTIAQQADRFGIYDAIRYGQTHGS